MLSKTVKKTRHEGQEVLYNTITRKMLPISASKQELEDQFFLDGMEMQAINMFLNRKMPRIGFTVIPTWECNLRCTHCTVLNKLVKKDNRQIDHEKIADFIERYSHLYSEAKSVHIDFVGGEPLLVCSSIMKYIESLSKRDLKISHSITTNLAVPLSDEVIDLLKTINYITVSLDGMEESHNEQRKSFDNSNPFETTVNNLKQIIKLGMLDKIAVQSALKDKWINIENKKAYYKQLMILGIPFDKIKFACLHPTDNTPDASAAYRTILSRGDIQNNICCKFRNNQMVLDGHKLYSDYYSWQLLGTIDDFEQIAKNRIDMVHSELSVLNDETCRSCPVIGCCWGGCVNARNYFINPSKYCNQQKLIDIVNKSAEDNTLVERLASKT